MLAPTLSGSPPRPQPQPHHPRVRILGSCVDLLSLRAAIGTMERWIDARAPTPRHIVVTGFHGLWEAHQRPAFRHLLAGADLWLPDGIAPVWIARLRGHQHLSRIPGAELMEAFFELAEQRGFSSYFYGDTPDALSALQTRLLSRFPNHRIAGTFSPPFRTLTPEEDEEIIANINRARPDVLWVGLGLPRQEIWIHEHKSRLDVPILVGVGAAFGFLSGRVKRCPPWMGRNGLEWAYRLLAEPRKLWRRDFLQAPRFLIAVGRELLNSK